MFRNPKFIVLAAVALYAIGLAVAWREVDTRAVRRAQAMLEAAERGYGEVINGELDAALRNVGGAVINLIGESPSPQPWARMQELAKIFNIDEINIVDAKGVVVGSNVPAVMNFSFCDHPATREFMALTNPSVTVVSQPFRKGVANPEMFCKYHGVSFPRHDGFVQVGTTVERLRQNMYNYTDREADRILRNWHFSVVGWYERADADPLYEPGRTVRRMDDELGEMAVGRFFEYCGFRYVAYLPESYCYSQRNAAFSVTALVLGALLFFFTYFLVRLANASAKLERLHAAAAKRSAADLALARKIQMSALPAAGGAFIEHLGFSLSAECRPAREVGGDFYDFFHLPGRRLAFLVADVSGKGIPGALFMMEAKNVVKNCLVEFSDLAEAVQEANRRLCENNRAELFVTAWIGALDVRTGIVEYVNAGHNRPFVRRADGTVEKVRGKGGKFLGMFEGEGYRSHALELAPGDVLCIYTDGITEAMNACGEQFGEGRLTRAFTGFDDGIGRALEEFVGTTEQSDDITRLMLRWNGAPQRFVRDFAAVGDSLGPALGFVREALGGSGGREVFALLNAVDEISSNVVSHSGASGFRVTVEKGFDRLRVSFSDDGVAYNPLLHADPDTHAPIDERPVGGLGLVVVKRLVDSVAYVREAGRNVLTLVQRCGPVA